MTSPKWVFSSKFRISMYTSTHTKKTVFFPRKLQCDKDIGEKANLQLSCSKKSDMFCPFTQVSNFKLTLLLRGCPKFLDLEIPVPKSRFDPESNSYKGLRQCSTFVQIEAYQVSHSFAYLHAKIKKLSRSQYFLKSE